MIYYPVIIPTLNRVDHLKRCLDSLIKNTGAEYTEVYISVDFPPADKYKEGYCKVKEYLNTEDFSTFKSFNVIYQEKNLGPTENYMFLHSLVKEKFDAYILTEDDNEFSPNFLVYMNQCMEKFKDNPDVIGVCGSKDTEWVADGKNIVFSKLLSGYGVGCWIDVKSRENLMAREVIIPPILHSPKKMYELYKKNVGLFCIYILSVLSTDTGLFWKKNGELNWCDTIYSIYMHFTDAVCVVPAVAKARTWGNDGSGVNMTASGINPQEAVILDENRFFESDNTEDIRFLEENYVLGNDYIPYGKFDVIKAIICYMILFAFRKNRKTAVKLIKRIRILFK